MEVVLSFFFQHKSCKKNPEISVLIPVYCSENTLKKCLWSVFKQNFKCFEIVVVNDGSLGNLCKKIVNQIRKNGNNYRHSIGLPQVELKYIEHSKNMGLVETRRTAFLSSIGKWITCLDSDDEMHENALTSYYKYTSDYDIIQGATECGVFTEQESFLIEKDVSNWRNHKVYFGSLEGHDIFHKWFVNVNYDGVLWNKLVKRELYEFAFENIPFCECNFGEDVLIYFFLSIKAKSYFGMKDVVCRYNLDTGMSSKKTIKDLQTLKMYCSQASSVMIIENYVKEFPSAFTKKEIRKIEETAFSYIQNNIAIVTVNVVPELKDTAYEMLCDYWGKNNVIKVEKFLKNRGIKFVPV